jgi:hypothetical protein
MSRSVVGVAGCLWLISTGGPATAQAVLYDSGGFEAPRFTAGPVEGQDVLFGSWQRSAHSGPASTATVQTAVTDGGSQALRVDRATNDFAYWSVPIGSPVPLTVNIQWDMRVDQAANVGQVSGPFFGVVAYGSGGLIGALGVDSFTRDAIYLDPTLGFQPSTPRTFMTMGVFHHYRLELDYNGSGGGTYEAFVDGTQLPISNTTFASPFVVNSGNNDLNRSYIAALPSAADAASQAATGTAYFDNYSITLTAVPEPTALALTGLGLVFPVVCRRTSRARRRTV